MNNDTPDSPPADVEQDGAPTPTAPEGTGTQASICETVLNAAHAVNRHYTERLARRCSRTSGLQ